MEIKEANVDERTQNRAPRCATQKGGNKSEKKEKRKKGLLKHSQV